MRDEIFIRGKIPMTKSEVRAISLSKLELGDQGIFYDIGAGTGSVSVEAAMILRSGRIFAVEQKEEGCELIKANKAKFGIKNIEVIHGLAPGCLTKLPAPDYAFIGGSSGDLIPIVKDLEHKNPNVRVVLNAVTLETLTWAVSWLKVENRRADIISVQIARAREAGSYRLMEGNNPVYIITFGGGNEKADTTDTFCGTIQRKR